MGEGPTREALLFIIFSLLSRLLLGDDGVSLVWNYLLEAKKETDKTMSFQGSLVHFSHIPIQLSISASSLIWPPSLCALIKWWGKLTGILKVHTVSLSAISLVWTETYSCVRYRWKKTGACYLSKSLVCENWVCNSYDCIFITR